MNEELTLLEILTIKKKKRKIIIGSFITILTIAIFSTIFLYPKIFSNREKAVLGEKEIINDYETDEEPPIPKIEIPKEDEIDKVDEEPVKPTQDNTYKNTENKTIEITQVPPIENTPSEVSPEPPAPKFCSASDIATYNQIISTAEFVINSAKAYIANPSCEYPYTPSSCNLTYNNCVTSVENWYTADGTCSRLPRSGMCATLNQQRYDKLLACEEARDYCNETCEEYKISEVFSRLEEIEYKENLIIETTQKLSDCNI